MAKTCYMCNDPAVSVEHAPPRCIFPKDKRQGRLITVPSCARHNMETSKDDEYLRGILTMCIGGNLSGANHFLNKTKKIYDKSPRLHNDLKNKSTPVIAVDLLTSKPHSTAAIEFDAARIQDSFDKIGRALHFDHFGKKFSHQIDVILAFAKDLDGNDFNLKLSALCSKFEEAFQGLPYLGDNQDVFKYQIFDTSDALMMHLSFYEGPSVYLLFKR